MTLVLQVQKILRLYDDKRAELNRDFCAFDSKCQKIAVFVVSILFVIVGLFLLLSTTNAFSYKIIWIKPISGKILGSISLAGGFALLLTAIIGTITNPEYKKSYTEKLKIAQEAFQKNAQSFIQNLSPKDLAQTIQFATTSAEQIISDVNLQHSQPLHQKTPSSHENFEVSTRTLNYLYMAELSSLELTRRHETCDPTTAAALRKVKNLTNSIEQQFPI